MQRLKQWKEKEKEKRLCYVGVAKKYGVDESTLRRRYQGKCIMCAEAAQMRQKLNPKQEEELCKYVNTLTERALPSTRTW
jgi:polyferredoxin